LQRSYPFNAWRHAHVRRACACMVETLVLRDC